MNVTGSHVSAAGKANFQNAVTRIVARKTEPAAGDVHSDELCWTSDKGLQYRRTVVRSRPL